MYNFNKLLPIKLVWSQSQQQNGPKFPHLQACYRRISIFIIDVNAVKSNALMKHFDETILVSGIR